MPKQQITKTPKRIIDKALSQVGVKEGRNSDGSYNNDQRYSDETPGLEWSDGQPWCATFVAWCAYKSALAALYPRTASCDVAGQWFKDRNQWSQYPAVGAQVFFGYTSDLNHTGIVIDFNTDYITTVEGNTNEDGGREGHSVLKKTRARRGLNIIGYGYPAFPEGIVSADPAWKDRAPKDEPKPTPAPAPAPVVESKTKAADAAYEDAVKAQAAAKDPARKKAWQKVIDRLKGLSSRY